MSFCEITYENIKKLSTSLTPSPAAAAQLLPDFEVLPANFEYTAPETEYDIGNPIKYNVRVDRNLLFIV